VPHGWRDKRLALSEAVFDEDGSVDAFTPYFPTIPSSGSLLFAGLYSIAAIPLVGRHTHDPFLLDEESGR
jgi:hypothetical protein